jgi:hypothetical protein
MFAHTQSHKWRQKWRSAYTTRHDCESSAWVKRSAFQNLSQITALTLGPDFLASSSELPCSRTPFPSLPPAGLKYSPNWLMAVKDGRSRTLSMYVWINFFQMGLPLNRSLYAQMDFADGGFVIERTKEILGLECKTLCWFSGSLCCMPAHLTEYDFIAIAGEIYSDDARRQGRTMDQILDQVGSHLSILRSVSHAGCAGCVRLERKRYALRDDHQVPRHP